VIEARGLGKSYATREGLVTALRDVSFSMGLGHYVSLMGESGAGKSTLLKLLGCLDVPSCGSYRFDGAEVGHLDERQLAALRNGHIGFIFQSSHFVDYLDVVDNVALASLYGPSSSPDRERATMLLERVGLGHRLRHLPAQLSGGERQRAAAARALYHSPKLVLADEPTGNLDRLSAERITRLFEEIVDEGISVLVVTHDPEVAAQARRHCRLVNGAIEE